MLKVQGRPCNRSEKHFSVWLTETIYAIKGFGIAKKANAIRFISAIILRTVSFFRFSRARYTSFNYVRFFFQKTNKMLQKNKMRLSF